MKLSVVSGDLATLAADVVVVAQLENGDFSPSLSALDKASHGYFSAQKEKGNLPAKVATARLFVDVAGVSAERVLVVKLGEKQLAQGAGIAVNMAREYGWEQVVCALAELGACPQSALERVFKGVAQADYVFDAYKSEKQNRKALSFQAYSQAEAGIAQAALTYGEAYLKGSYKTRDLVNTPPNVCVPAYLGEQALEMAKRLPLTVQVLVKKDIEALGMGGVLGVGQGSVNEPRFIIMEYKHPEAKNAQPIVLVGKGVTFDTGGISIKPAAGMDEMKGDMGGAAAVFGAMEALCAAKLPLHVVALVASVENMPDGNAIRPGDILKSLSGKTVEVLNTDAEGRLILMDALTYAERYNPQAVIDMATLTGAIVIALGSHRAGLMGNNEALVEDLFQAGERAEDLVWKMPIDKEYLEMMKSPFADIANISGTREAGSLTAGAFLSAFAEKYPWAHLDIAGVSFASGKNKGGTGRPVALLLEYFRTVAA
ncbi:MAG: leucyl aminopeptidase [Cardiobacteriaceae bacterium]|nr:leucyl aminopeptidase [Cardiobacteriaceae bacterium]